MAFSLPPGVEEILPLVEKPARYIGGERNSFHKPDADLRFALAFPDTYEIGMSHLGFRLLYAILNAHPRIAAERVFAPWPDMEREMRQRGIPLFTLETGRPVSACDVIGFSLQYELAHTNLLTMLDLAGIPPRAADRDDRHPLVVAGGPLALHPEPVSDFFDAFLLGDGEEVVQEFCSHLLASKREEIRREDLLRGIAGIEGIYVPFLYERRRDPRSDHWIVQPPTGPDGPPFPVKRRYVRDLNAFPFPAAVIVPYTDIVHNRVSVEIMRGCNAGCRFCQAGYAYRPERYRTPARIRETVEGGLRATGFDEVSLTSLNSGEYPALEPLMIDLMRRMAPENTGMSLSSLRANSVTDSMAQEISRVRRTGITIAPEAGSQRMRDIINKGITEEEILRGADVAFRNGWDLIKLYFMIGLPMETDEDVDAIGHLALRILEIGRRHRGGRAQIHLSVSNFIPKPWTPFQWAAMVPPEELERRQKRIARIVRRTAVRHKGHDFQTSWLEGVFARGDRSLGPVIQTAWLRGCRFDGWGEHFRPDLWRAAFEKEGIDPDLLAHRALGPEDPLPWDHIDCLVTKKYLRADLRKSEEARSVGTCGTDNCLACGTFARSCVTGVTSNRPGLPSDLVPVSSLRSSLPATEAREEDPSPPTAPPAASPCVYRISYRKTGLLRFISHLDLIRTLTYALRRAGLPLAWTEGFSPKPKFSFGPALPVGVEGLDEILDLTLREPVDPAEIQCRVNLEFPPELRFNDVRRKTAGTPSLSQSVGVAVYSVDVSTLPIGEESPSALLRPRIRSILDAPSLVVERAREDGPARRIDLRPAIADVRFEPAEDRLLLYLRLGSGPQARPEEVLRLLLDRDAPSVRVVRERLLRETHAGFFSSLPPVRHRTVHAERHPH